MTRKPCHKIRYRDRVGAEFARSQHRTRVPLRAYLCQNCRGWHLTSQPKQQKGG